MTIALFNQSEEYRQKTKSALENKNGVAGPQASIQKENIKNIYLEI